MLKLISNGIFLVQLLSFGTLTHGRVCQFQRCIKEGFLLKQTGSFQVSYFTLK